MSSNWEAHAPVFEQIRQHLDALDEALADGRVHDAQVLAWGIRAVLLVADQVVRTEIEARRDERNTR